MPAGEINIAQLPEQLWTLLVDPATNVRAALLLYGIIALVLFIVIVLAVLFVMGSSEDEDEAYVSADSPARRPRADREAVRERKPFARLIGLGVVLAVLGAVWVATGYTTANSAVCDSCHVDTPHDRVVDESANAHKGSACVSCHEPGGRIANYTSAVPGRIVHFAINMTKRDVPEQYGRVTSSACSSCHRRDIRTTTLDETRGVRMSHVEPLEAGASCLDCHKITEGLVGPHAGGMKSCLRCHDSKIASAECESCHDKRSSMAARARTVNMASVQVPEVKCGACHDEKRECDTCHGMRMPHSREFKAYAHARAGAVNFYYQNGKACSKCHTPTRNPCQRCHTPKLGKGHPANNLENHALATESACNTCHSQWALTITRDFCTDLCHTPAAEQGSPR